MNINKKRVKKTTKKQWGGPRPGSGPKKKEKSQLKKPVTLYFTKETIEIIGGEDKIKELCYNDIKEKEKFKREFGFLNE